MNPRTKLVLAAGSALLVLLVAGPAWAQSGKELFTSKGCVACHGVDGKKTLLPNYPRLAGQNAAYAKYALNAYKAQQRQGEQAPLMVGMAGQLSEPEIDKIADFLSKIE